MNKTVLTSFTILCLLSILFLMVLSFNIQTVKASGTIYIRADGSVDPPSENITSVDNVTYTFIGNIYDEIVVERSNITIDGNGYSLQGSGGFGDSNGMSLSGSNVTIKNLKIMAFYHGIWSNMSSNNTIYGNNITNNEFGIRAYRSSNNNISGNGITENNEYGIRLYGYSDNNMICGNNITASNRDGILLSHSSGNTVSGNDITENNRDGIQLLTSSNNTISENNIANNYYGIQLRYSSNNTISGNNITASNRDGILLSFSSGNMVSGNNIANNYYGLWLYDYSSNNTISGNNIANNHDGLQLSHSSNNTISGNNITANDYYGIRLSSSSRACDNLFFHNNLVDNTPQVVILYGSGVNFWDNGFEGNYWSDYVGGDLDNDGIGDVSYVSDANNTDNHPLMGMFYDFTVEIEWGQIYHVTAISNSTVSDLHVLTWLSSPNEYVQPGQKFIDFYVTGEEGTVGFCRTMIPRAVLNDSYTVLVDWQEVPVKELPISNSTHAYLYFTYNHSTQEVIIIPEFPSILILPLFMVATLLAVIAYKRKHQTRNKKREV